MARGGTPLGPDGAPIAEPGTPSAYHRAAQDRQDGVLIGHDGPTNVPSANGSGSHPPDAGGGSSPGSQKLTREDAVAIVQQVRGPDTPGARHRQERTARRTVSTDPDSSIDWTTYK